VLYFCHKSVQLHCLAKDTQIAAEFFAALGPRIQRLRERAGYSQEDMISFGYDVRYWQRIEGRQAHHPADVVADLPDSRCIYGICGEGIGAISLIFNL
jgi:hypothetical protein